MLKRNRKSKEPPIIPNWMKIAYGVTGGLILADIALPDKEASEPPAHAREESRIYICDQSVFSSDEELSNEGSNSEVAGEEYIDLEN